MKSAAKAKSFFDTPVRFIVDIQVSDNNAAFILRSSRHQSVNYRYQTQQANTECSYGLGAKLGARDETQVASLVPHVQTRNLPCFFFHAPFTTKQLTLRKQKALTANVHHIMSDQTAATASSQQVEEHDFCARSLQHVAQRLGNIWETPVRKTVTKARLDLSTDKEVQYARGSMRCSLNSADYLICTTFLRPESDFIDEVRLSDDTFCGPCEFLIGGVAPSAFSQFDGSKGTFQQLTYQFVNGIAKLNPPINFCCLPKSTAFLVRTFDAKEVAFVCGVLRDDLRACVSTPNLLSFTNYAYKPTKTQAYMATWNQVKFVCEQPGKTLTETGYEAAEAEQASDAGVEPTGQANSDEAAEAEQASDAGVEPTGQANNASSTDHTLQLTELTKSLLQNANRDEALLLERKELLKQLEQQALSSHDRYRALNTRAGDLDHLIYLMKLKMACQENDISDAQKRAQVAEAKLADLLSTLKTLV